MERNLIIRNTLPFLPNRSCKKNAGPFVSNFISNGMIRNNGDRHIIAMKEIKKSIILLKKLGYML